MFLAAISYIPSFLTQPGKIAADTKQYLYLDPGRLIQSAISAWDPDFGAGTVTHENIGFLFPMGPYYWLVAELHIPLWVGQRFWMGSLFFAAGTGVWFLGRLLGLTRSGRLAAALAYMLTPYVLDYITRISGIVMPWAALGWMLALTILAVRKGGWRYPALFAVVIALVGGVNATSILLVGLAPLLWVVYAVWGTHEARLRAALGAVARLGVLSLGVSVWWMAGFWAEGAYGLNVLKYTETVPTVSSTSLSSEVLRGLGYWYFYGQDKLGPWTLASAGYLQWSWLIVVSFLVPTLAVAAAMVVRWRYRAFAIALILVGVVLAVGTYPFQDPSPFGRLIKAAGPDSTAELALRSTNRIVPFVLLGLGLLLGAGITALTARVRWAGRGLLLLSVVLIAADLPPLWDGGLVATNLERPSTIPAYVYDAAAYMNGKSHDTRVMQLPGQDFAYYRWGITSDPVWPGLMTRPYVIRAAQPAGEPASVNLLQALDESLQDGVFVPSTLVPVAGLMSAGDILYESDVQFERFGTARPQPTWHLLNDPATGLGRPVTFGTPRLYPTIEYPLTDETQLAIPTGAAIPPPVAVFPVPGARPITRTESPRDPLVVAGDGRGLMEAAAAGLLASDPTIFYSATFADDPAGLDRQLQNGAVLVVTDSNQKQLSTWGTVVDNYGYVEQANETPLASNPAEEPNTVFAGAGSGTQTVAVVNGVASVRATAYSNPITNTAENQPLNAADGNPETSWKEGAFSPATGESIQVKLVHPVSTDHVTLLQPQNGARNRTVTRATLTFDGRSPVTVPLGAASTERPGPGGVVPQADVPHADRHGGRHQCRGAEGLPEPERGGLRRDLHPRGAAGHRGPPAAHRPARRGRAVVHPPPAGPGHEPDPRPGDPAPLRPRDVDGPAVRAADGASLLRGGHRPDLHPGPRSGDRRSPRTDGTPGAVTVVSSASSGRLPGDLRAGAAAAVDGDPTTSWSPGLGVQPGTWVQYQLSGPLTFDHLDLQVVTDGKHSVPTSITVTTPAGSRTVPLPPIPAGTGRPQGSVTSVPVQLPGPHRLRGEDHRGLGPAPRASSTTCPTRPNTDPVALAEIGLPGLSPVTTPVEIPGRCYSDLVAVDGHPVDVEVTGSTATALANGGLTIRGCGTAAQGIALGPGTHTLTTSTSVGTGLDVDAVQLGSSAGGSAEPLTAAGLLQAPPSHPSPPVQVLRQGRTTDDRPGPRGRNPVLDGARPEPERRVEGHHLHRPRPVVLDAHRRVCQRLVRAGRRGPGPDHHHADLGTPAGGDHGHLGLGGHPGGLCGPDRPARVVPGVGAPPPPGRR